MVGPGWGLARGEGQGRTPGEVLGDTWGGVKECWYQAKSKGI